MQSANPDGSNVQWVHGAPTSVQDVASDGSHLYFTESAATQIGRMNADGTGVNSALVKIPTPTCGPYPGAEAPSPHAIAVDGSHIYWADPSNGTIGRANLDGSSPDDQFMPVYYPCGSSGVGFQQGPMGVAVDGGHIYWTNPDNGTIGRANVDGTGVNQSFISGASHPVSVAVSGGDVYWSNTPTNGTLDGGSDSIGHARLDSSGAVVPATVNQSFIGGTRAGTQLAAFGGFLYFDNGDGWIGRATSDGATIVRHLVQPEGGGTLVGSLGVDAGQASSTTTSVSCIPASLDVIEHPIDSSTMTLVNMHDATRCTFTVRDTGPSPRAVNGTISFAQSPSEGVWLYPRGPLDAPSGTCRLVPGPAPGQASCTVGYETSPDARGFVRGATRTTFVVAYGGESAHDPSTAGSFALPLVIVHVCGQTRVAGEFLVCDAHGRVVNGGGGSPGSSKTLPVRAGRLTVTATPACVPGGTRIVVKLALRSPPRAQLAVQRVSFAIGRGPPQIVRHSPFVVRLKVHGGSRTSLQLNVRAFMTARGRHLVKTMTIPVRVC